MAQSQLHLFKKNTDASASIRGYNYQILKTVEAWLTSFIHESDESIYCDFEEDIFHRNETQKRLKFRQIKLYSSNFSFSRDEIQKCIIHFFLLNFQLDYRSHDKIFVFEASSSIARDRGNNDAELLRDWHQNQKNLNEELLLRCQDKVKELVSRYMINESEKLKEQFGDDLINKAIVEFETIDNEEWSKFTKSIRWIFHDRTAEVEFLHLKDNIEKLIRRLPFPISDKEISTLFGLLHSHVFQKASSSEPEKRKLDMGELRHLFLESINESDEWYWEVYEKCKHQKHYHNFNIGEFYEIVDASVHCRYNSHLSVHISFWKETILSFIEVNGINKVHKRKAIYEYLWLRFNALTNLKGVNGDLFGESRHLEFYFEDFGEFKSSNELKDAISILFILDAAISFEKTDVLPEQLDSWLNMSEDSINGLLDHTSDINEKCRLWENLGMLKLYEYNKNSDSIQIEEVFRIFENIVKDLDQAQFYDVAGFGRRLSKYLHFIIEISPDKEEIIAALEDIEKSIQPIIQDRYGAHGLAKQEVEKGRAYLQSNKPTLLLKALTSFHNAKSLWNNQDYIEGFALTLINITQLYLSIGMNLAAKYYALSVIWLSMQNEDTSLLKRVINACGFVFISDFRQGSWINAINSFSLYMGSVKHLRSNVLDLDKDEFTSQLLSDFVLILFASPIFSNELDVVVQNEIDDSAEIGKEIISPLIKELKKKYSNPKKLEGLLKKTISDFPLNDIGIKRCIQFNALGSNWKICFNNDVETISIAEEFCAMIQIMITEIALSKYDYHLTQCDSINIFLELSQETLKPEQKGNNIENSWIVYSKCMDSKNPKDIQVQAGKITSDLMTILDSFSLLPSKEFREVFLKLFEESDLANKALVIGSYQRIHRSIISMEELERRNISKFQPIDLKDYILDFPITNHLLPWKSNLSHKYDKRQSIENIKNRNKATKKCIHRTLDLLIPDPDFAELIRELRSNGWQDWQIILSMLNFILNYKIQLLIKREDFGDDVTFQEAYNKKYFELLDLDEDEFYVKFPVEAFKSSEFTMQLNHTLVIILQSYDLENKARFPNFNSIKHFLDKRFNVSEDESEEDNLLQGIV